MTAKSSFCLYMPPVSSITSYMEMVDLAAEHGIRQLETLNLLDLSTPDKEFAKKLRAYADEKGIAFPCVSMGLSLVDDDYLEVLEIAKGYVEIAAILGSPFFHHTIAMEFENYQHIADNFELFYSRGLTVVRELYDYAQTFGIRTVYEDQGFLFNGRENFSRFLRDVGRDVGIVADFGNIQFVDEQVEDFIPLFRDRIVHVHVKDYLVTPGSNRQRLEGEYRSKGGNYLLDVLVGKGSVHVEEAFRMLRQIGYHGAVSLESGPIGPDEAASFRENLATVRDYIEKYL